MCSAAALRMSGKKDMWSVIQSALAAWWRELIPLTLMNVVWLLLQLPLVTAAPATAAFYTVAESVMAGDPASWQEFWQGFRRYFWKALRWGLWQVVVYGVGLFNLAYYGEEGGLLWDALRAAWVAGLVVWTALQLLYWPLLLAATDQRIVNTLRNALVMLTLNPLFVAVLLALTAVVVVLSVATAAPIGLAMMAWITLLGSAAVRCRLNTARQT
jgi:uncharacterized membrane protein YesL